MEATCSPTAAATACSFDPELLRQMGEALGEECRAESVGVLLGPAANIKRSPLCGRNFEYFSEDPLLTGEMAAALIEGDVYKRQAKEEGEACVGAERATQKDHRDHKHQTL